MHRLKQILELVTTMAVLIVACGAGYVLYASRSPLRAPASPVPSEPIALAGLPVFGQRTAPYGIVEFSDFECPYCGKFVEDTLPELNKALIQTGQVQFYFANFPLPMHPNARPAAEAALCSQNFYETHDLFFRNRPALADVVAQVRSSETQDCAAAVDASVALGKKLSVLGTPTFFLGVLSADRQSLHVKSVLAGAASLASFTSAIKELGK